MKKSRGLIVAFVPLFIVGIGLWFWPEAAALADDKHSSSQHGSPSPSGHEGDRHDEHDGHNDDEHHGDSEGEHKSNKDEDKCTICHVPPGNPANAHTLVVGCSAVDAHLRNHPGDCLGPCPCQPTPKQNP